MSNLLRGGDDGRDDHVHNCYGRDAHDDGGRDDDRVHNCCGRGGRRENAGWMLAFSFFVFVKIDNSCMDYKMLWIGCKVLLVILGSIVSTIIKEDFLAT